MFSNILSKPDGQKDGPMDSIGSIDATEPASPSIAASPHWQSTLNKVNPRGFSPFVGFCFTINYILGTGFLTIPWAFTQGGLLLSTILLITVGFLSDMAKDYVLETMARAEVMLDNRMHWIKKGENEEDEEKGRLVISPMIRRQQTPTETDELLPHGGSFEKTSSRTMENKFIPAIKASPKIYSVSTTPVSSQPGTPTGRKQILLKRLKPKYLVQDRKFEINALCRIFLGKSGLRVYTFFLFLYIYCTLWAYTSVFSSAMAREFPILNNDGTDEAADYTMYALIFGSIVVPLSCLELDEQVVIQVTMTGCRFLMLFLMLSTSTLCAHELGVTTEERAEVPLIRFSGLHKMLPIIVFAHIYHHSIPGLSDPVADKRKLSGIFSATCIFSTVGYSLIGIVLGFALGPQVEQSSNLSWNNFHGGTGYVDEETGKLVDVAWWAKAISIYIICFPALDVLSAFPLNAITLGNNMLGAVYGSKIHKVEGNRLVKIQFRLLASVPPLILGILVRELGTITDFAGTTGFMIGFSFPAILYLTSKKRAKAKKFATNTFYTSYASYNSVAWAVFVFGAAMFLYVVFCLAKGDE